MDYEHRPTPGPVVWIGAGLLIVVGGAALAGVSSTDPDDTVLTLLGGLLVAAGLASAVIGAWQLVRRRRGHPKSPK